MRIDPRAWNSAVMTIAAAAFALIFGIVWGGVITEGCPVPKWPDAPFGCIEALVFRYQALLGVVGAFGVALYAARPVYLQLAEQRRQSAQKSYEFLRERSEQLHRERHLLYGATSAAELALDAIVPGRAFGATRSSPQAASAFLGEQITAMRDGIGPAWGTADQQIARNRCLDDLFTFGVTFNAAFPSTSKQLSFGTAHMVIHAPRIQRAYETARSSSVAFHSAIEDESRRLAPLIADLETALLIR